MSRAVVAGRHAAQDGSYRRSVLLAAGRAAALVGVAVVLGVVILQATSDKSPKTPASAVQPAVTTSTRFVVTPRSSSTTSTTASTATSPGGVRKPDQVHVLVLNASGKNGQAAAMTDKLNKAGYSSTLTPGTATKVQKTTIVYYKAGFEREAKALAAAVGPGVPDAPLPSPPPGPNTDKADCVVVVGSG